MRPINAPIIVGVLILGVINSGSVFCTAWTQPWTLQAASAGFVAVLSTVVNYVNAVEPIWSYDGCGYSQYSDAGTMPLSASQRIIGGQSARPNEFPWQAWIQWTGYNSLQCGAVILNSRWIVTSAWCTYNAVPADFTIIVGDHQRSQPNPDRQTLQVARIVRHPLFDEATYENDISLIETTSYIQLNTNVFPICAPDSANLYVNRLAQISGWGTTRPGEACCQDELRYTTMNVTSNDWCQAAIPGLTILDSMVCATDNAGNRNRGACIGDGGGPLSVKELDDKFHLVGITSWHVNECTSGYPEGYTRITSHIDWISSYVLAVYTTSTSQPTTTTPSPVPKLYPVPYVIATQTVAMNASDAISASCSSFISSDFRTSFQEIVSRINSAIAGGRLCTDSGGVYTISPGQIQYYFIGNQVQVQFNLLVGTNPAEIVTIGLDETCSWEASQFVLVPENWRQPVISNIFGCPVVDITPPGFTWQSSQWGCFG